MTNARKKCILVPLVFLLQFNRICVSHKFGVFALLAWWFIVGFFGFFFQFGLFLEFILGFVGLGFFC